METIRTICCKLNPSEHQILHIEATMKAFAEACNFVAQEGREHQIYKQFELHKHCYQTIRERLSLSANLAVRAIARVSPRLKKAKTRNSTFTPTSVDYDARIFSLNTFNWVASLTLLSAREKIPLIVGDFQREALTGEKPTSATLTQRKGSYYLNIQIKEPADSPLEPKGALGVDLGIKNIATLSDGTQFSGTKLNSYRQKRGAVRASLQSKTHQQSSRSTRKNVRKCLKRLSGKEHRYQKWVNHHLSKQIVRIAKEREWAIAMEDLKGIRQSTNRKLRKSQRGLHNSWSFYQLQQFVQYKAQQAGVPVVKVNPRYTSQRCHLCSQKGVRKGTQFTCIEHGVMDADFNASVNIAMLGAELVIQPELSKPKVA